MKTNLFFMLIFSILSLSGIAQDRIIKTTNDTITCQIKEIGDDEVKYTQKEFKSDVIFGIDKNKISRIIFSDGKELTFKNSMYDSAQYEKQHKNALKVGFLSPLFGATCFTYERSLKPGSSWEASLGIIGLGENFAGNSSNGLYLKFGYKFIKSPDFYLKGMRYSHILKGAYIRPEVSFSTYNSHSGLNRDSNGNEIQGSYSTKTSTMYSIMLNTGKQWVVVDRFLFDWFVGVGYGFGNPNDDNSFHFAYLGGSSSSHFAMTSGIRIGILF
jgi:hypothetical protein